MDRYSDSDWAGSTDRRSQSNGVLFVDGAAICSFSRRQSVIATSSGMAEFYAGCATAEEMLLARDVLMFFGCRVEVSLYMDSAAARGIFRREGVGKAKSLEVRTRRNADSREISRHACTASKNAVEYLPRR